MGIARKARPTYSAQVTEEATAPLPTRIAHGLAALFRPGPRLVDEAECMLSVLLAILLAHLIGARNVSWAAFSGYMVMRGHVADSLLRGVLRIIGTGAGAALALLLVPDVRFSLPVATLLSALVGGVALYRALTSRRAYAWLFVGLTFEMILLDTLEHPEHAVQSVAMTRMLEVGAGTLACVVVSSFSAFTARRRWPAARMPQAHGVVWHAHAARHAAQATTALALLPPLSRIFGLPELAQSAITIMAVMLVPLSSLGASGLGPVSRRLLQRIAGGLAGSALAALFLFAAHGSAPVLIAGTMLGVMMGRHIENGRSGIAYAGTQFTLAILVTLVPDSYANAAIAPALARLTGILVGMALLEPVLIAWHVVAPAIGPRSHATEGEQQSTE